MTGGEPERSLPKTAGLAVVGGVYREVVVEPSRRALMGSGMRAAAILAGLGTAPKLHCRLDAGSSAEAGAVARVFGVELAPVDRPYAIEFNYYTPLSVPVQTIPPPTVAAIEVVASQVVAFGMSEGPWRLVADLAVVDFQHASPESSGLIDSDVRRLAVVVNAREVRRLTSEVDPVVGGRALLEQLGAEVVVVKRGISGATAVAKDGAVDVGAHPTSLVQPVGSGDAFTAGFAAGWLQGQTPADAARFASQVAAVCCSYGDLLVNEERIGDLAPAVPLTGAAQVYLAGPFFSLAERWLVNHARDALKGLGVQAFSPIHDVGLGQDEVAVADIAGLEASDSVLALLDHGDPGTVFEIGWAVARGMPVVALVEDPHSSNWTMLRGTGCEVQSDLSTAVYRAGWHAIARVGS